MINTTINHNSSHFERCFDVGILGATGVVGQNFVCMLSNHQSFKIKALGASTKSANKKYKDVVKWKMCSFSLQDLSSKDMVICECAPENFVGCQIIFSALDSCVAGEIESIFVNRGFKVFTNSKNHRMNPKVPLIIPTCNPHFFEILNKLKISDKNQTGFLIANANCSTTGLCVVLRCLQSKFGKLKNVVVQTMQAISGAGYPGCSALDITNNCIPYIQEEEEKIEIETKKILGEYNNELNRFEDCEVKISAQCTRVNVIEGHLETVMIDFETLEKPSIEEIKKALASYQINDKYKTESFPRFPIRILEETDRPQPRLDCNLDNGFCVSIGRIRKCNIFDVKLVLLVHNTVLGAAGSSILNAEVAIKIGLIK